MPNKVKKNMGLGLMFAGAFFLFEPYFSVFDFFPDVIGYCLIFAALAQFADINYHIEEARIRFKKAIYVYVAKILFLILTFGLMGQQDRPVMTALYSFIFTVADCVILIPAFKEFFEGLLYSAAQTESNTLYRRAFSEKKNSRLMKRSYTDGNITSKAYAASVRFLIVKNITVMIPELTSLINDSYYEFVGLLRLLGVILSLWSGIDWLVYIIRFMRLLLKDRVYMDYIEGKYIAEILPNEGLQKRRSICSALTFIFLGFVLSADFYSDYINILPDFISSALITIGVLRLGVHVNQKNKTSLFLSLASTVVGIIYYAVSLRFYIPYYPEAIKIYYDAYVLYYAMLALEIVNALLYISVVCSVSFMLLNLLRRNGVDGQYKYRDSEMFKSAIAAIVFSILAEGTTVFYLWSQPYSIEIWFMEAASVISIVLCGVFALYSSLGFIDGVKSEINYKYRIS